MKSNNAKSNPLVSIKNYLVHTALDVNSSFPKFKWLILGFIGGFFLWIACVTSRIDPLVDLAIWFSVAIIFVALAFLILNIAADCYELVKVWSWLVGDSVLEKCKTIANASTEDLCASDNSSSKLAMIFLLICAAFFGFLARTFFLYAMCIVMNDGLFGDPAWYWLSIIAFEVVSIPSIFIHFALPVIDEELKLL